MFNNQNTHLQMHVLLVMGWYNKKDVGALVLTGSEDKCLATRNVAVHIS